MTTAQVVETSVTVNINSPIHDYVYPDDQTQATVFWNYKYNIMIYLYEVSCYNLKKAIK